MRVPLSWLRESVPFEVEPREARRGPDRRRPRGGRDRDRGRGHRPRARHHHEPRRLHERPRGGPRGGGPLRPAPAAARHLGRGGGGAGGRGARGDDRGPRPLRPLLRAPPRRQGGPVAGVASRPARARGDPLDQQRGRPHELRDDRDGPAEPRLRPRAGAGRQARGAVVARRGEARDPRRGGASPAGRCRRHRRARRRAGPGARRDHGRRLERDPRGHGGRGPRGRLVGPARRCAAERAPWGCTPRPRTASSAGPTSRPARPPSPAWRTSSRRSGPARVRPGLVEVQGQRAPGADGSPARDAGERAPRRRGAAAAAGADARVARLPRLRLRPRGDRPRAVVAPRRLARGGPRGGGGPPLRAAPDRALPASRLPPRAAPALPAARAADPRRPDRRGPRRGGELRLRGRRRDARASPTSGTASPTR